MQKKPIAIVAGQLVVGGAERQLYLWLSNIDRGRFDPVVLTMQPEPGDYWEEPIGQLGIPLLRVPRQPNRLVRLLKIASALRPYSPHLLHAWHLHASPYAGGAAKLLRAKASLGSLRGSFASFQQSALQAKLALWLVDAMIVNSECAGEMILKGQPKARKKLRVVPNAVEIPAQDQAQTRARLSQRWGLSETDAWVGTMGRFDPLKRFDLLLETVASLRQDAPTIRLLMIGYGPEEANLRAKAKSLGIESIVTFTGSDPTARTWLGALDVFCFPSVDEGMPNVIMEAAAAGVAVVGWRTPFMQDLLTDGVSGALVELQNEKAFRNALLSLLRDESLRSRLGQAARNRMIEHFSLGRYVERLSAIYESLLSDLPRTVSNKGRSLAGRVGALG